MSPEPRCHLPSTPAAGSSDAAPSDDVLVVRAFVDFWNFHIAMNRWRRGFRFDWSRLGPSLFHEVDRSWRESGRARRIQYGGLHLYISYNPTAPKDDALRRWAHTVLGRFEGVHVVLKARRPRQPPDCPGCHAPIAQCPCCGASMQRTMEKGLDTAIVTDMIRLAWEKRWDVAVLVSADGDFMPAVEHLQQRGNSVVHAGFSADRSALARMCGTSIDLANVLRPIERRWDKNALAATPAGHRTAASRFALGEERQPTKKMNDLVRKTQGCGD